MKELNSSDEKTLRMSKSVDTKTENWEKVRTENSEEVKTLRLTKILLVLINF